MINLRIAEEKDLEFLYNQLLERDPIVNISHKSMPSWEEHCKFFASNPYKEWWIIEVEGETHPNTKMIMSQRIGSLYLTENNEIGLFILKEHQGKGFGSIALEYFMHHRSGRFLANIAPHNNKSRYFFEKQGFKLIQRTFEVIK